MTELIKQSAIHIDAPLYTNSAPYDSAWGQPPASYHMLSVVNGVMLGQLISGNYQATSASRQVEVPEVIARPVVLLAIESTLQEGAGIWKELAKL